MSHDNRRLVNGNSVYKQYHWSATVYINNTIGLVITQTCKSKLLASQAGHVLQTWLAGPKTALHLPHLFVHWLVHAITMYAHCCHVASLWSTWWLLYRCSYCEQSYEFEILRRRGNIDVMMWDWEWKCQKQTATHHAYRKLLSDWEWLPGEPLNGLERWKAWFYLDMKYLVP